MWWGVSDKETSVGRTGLLFSRVIMHPPMINPPLPLPDPSLSLGVCLIPSRPPASLTQTQAETSLPRPALPPSHPPTSHPTPPCAGHSSSTKGVHGDISSDAGGGHDDLRQKQTGACMGPWAAGTPEWLLVEGIEGLQRSLLRLLPLGGFEGVVAIQT